MQNAAEPPLLLKGQLVRVVKTASRRTPSTKWHKAWRWVVKQRRSAKHWFERHVMGRKGRTCLVLWQPYEGTLAHDVRRRHRVCFEGGVSTSEVVDISRKQDKDGEFLIKTRNSVYSVMSNPV